MKGGLKGNTFVLFILREGVLFFMGKAKWLLHIKIY
jgi:hypothetical protein